MLPSPAREGPATRVIGLGLGFEIQRGAQRRTEQQESQRESQTADTHTHAQRTWSSGAQLIVTVFTGPSGPAIASERSIACNAL
jgi:hypothetical protein